MTEKIRSRDFNDTVRDFINERERNRSHLDRSFQRMLGKRTLNLIRQIGIAEINSSRSVRTITSRDLTFQLPNYDEARSLFFAVKKDYSMPFGWGRFMNVCACLDTKDSDSPVALASYSVDPQTYINGVTVAANTKWLGMNAVPKYEERVLGFINLLEVGEALQSGQSVEILLDKLPFLASDGETTVPVLPASGGNEPIWPTLHIPNAEDVEQRNPR